MTLLHLDTSNSSQVVKIQGNPYNISIKLVGNYREIKDIELVSAETPGLSFQKNTFVINGIVYTVPPGTYTLESLVFAMNSILPPVTFSISGSSVIITPIPAVSIALATTTVTPIVPQFSSKVNSGGLTIVNGFIYAGGGNDDVTGGGGLNGSIQTNDQNSSIDFGVSPGYLVCTSDRQQYLYIDVNSQINKYDIVNQIIAGVIVYEPIVNVISSSITLYNGNVYTVKSQTKTIYVVDENLTTSRSITINCQQNINAIAFDSVGNMYIIGTGAGGVGYEYLAPPWSGVATPVAGPVGCWGISIDVDNTVYTSGVASLNQYKTNALTKSWAFSNISGNTIRCYIYKGTMYAISLQTGYVYTIF